MKKQFVFHFIDTNFKPIKIINTVRMVEDFTFQVGELYTMTVDANIVAFRVETVDGEVNYDDLKIYFIYGKPE